MLIEIVNWSKYQPRHDIKSTSWFRLENTFWLDPTLTPLDSDGKLVWIVLLSLASQRQSAVFEVDLMFVRRAIGVRMKKLIETLEHFQANGKIRITPPVTLRGRNADVTLRTDETDETDGRYKKNVRCDPETGSEAPAAPAGPTSGDKANLPKLTFTDADMKAATWLQKAVVFHNPAARKVHKANLERWANDFRLMREQDGLADEVVKEALLRLFEPEHGDYVADPFWRIQVQSPAALRKHWDKVTAVINNAKPRAQGYAL